MSNKFSSPSLSVLRAAPQYVPLTDICQPKQWKTIPKAELKTKGYPVYGANGLIGYSDEYNHENKTILIACRGASCGAINVCLPKSYVTGNAMCLDNLNEESDLDFLQHYLQTYDFKKAISGSAQPQITRSGLSLIMIPILPVSLQRKISCILSAVDENKKQAEQTVKYLDSLIKSRFIEMFGDPCNPEDGKERKRLDSFCELRIGPFGSALHKEDYITGGHPLVNPSHIVNGMVKPDSNLTIDEEKYESLAVYHLLPGDVVLGRRGEIGRCAVVDKSGMICGTGSMILRPSQEIRSDYLQRVVSFPSFSRALENNAVGVTMKNLNAAIVGSAEIFLPELAEQDAFIEFVSQVDKLRFETQQQIEKLETLKKSLMQKYFG